MNIECSITGYQESRIIEKDYNFDGSIRDTRPVKDSEQYNLELSLPGGQTIKVGCSAEDYLNIIVPMLSATSQSKSESTAFDPQGYPLP